ncbi:DUF938 domain-containing protein [Afifella marina]|uniref:SAM-dependent methyltransferase n=1 Tax=Afifella marina DSM 2698 TaxID=1120955 RepID=A0A1G5MHF1_AFIMA|nr:DUF938 domain-containing protein [Afifella marina]MBK1625404.1 DUF938 domain-containing protein [Afifella marina DSM 2698]MBK1628981.1 DUF938 domain-containing protein [Afifella marina]MBK5916947.1 hypothetical protein [Afifella marina]RAI22762.1 hypothetical protein CH311_03630 [Afifella marina DSM 2698]SCZ24542.1 Protein of unknown function [Afifella marina DSM 2698]
MVVAARLLYFLEMTDFIPGRQSTSPVAAGDKRLDTRSFHKNHVPIREALTPFLKTRSGDVLEVGSGSGQHVLGFAKAFPQLTFWPSDIEPVHRASIAAWAELDLQPNLRDVVDLNLCDDWRLGESDGAAGRPPAELAAILAINILHVTPFVVSGHLMAGAGRYLADDGLLFIYGPFAHDGAMSESNAEFDAQLRAANSEWGLRDVQALCVLAGANGLKPVDKIEMPANNHILVYGR